MTTLARVFVVVIAATTGPASGDSLELARQQPLREISHSVDVRVVEGVATYVVQRRFENRGNVADEVRLSIDLPTGAAATGLRIRAQQKWHEGEFLERDTAAQRYAELTGRGVYDPKDPALLFWLSSNQLFLQMFPVMPRTVSTVEYTLTAPTEYRGGRYHISYPKALRHEKGDSAIQLVDPTIAVQGADVVVVDGRPVRGRTTLAGYVPEPTTSHDDTKDPQHKPLASLAFAPSPIPTWQARLGRVVASDKHSFARLELDLAPQVSSLPRNAQVVFVVDASHSAGPPMIEAQLAIARAYVRHVPDAQIEIVVYRRTAKRVFGRFVPASALAAAIRDAAGRHAFAPGNGSAIDDGARVAAGALANRTGARRIVLLTDELVRTTLSPTSALGALASLDPAIIVHVVVPELGTETKLLRDDDAALAALATTHHGVFARMSLHGGDAELVKTVLELVRPIRIDHLRHTLADHLVLAETLQEGEGLRLFEKMPRKDAPTGLAITGKLWSDPITLSISESTGFSRATAAFVFSADMHADLSEMEMMLVALQGRAVSPVTSYLAIEPGVRPSTIGLERGGTGWGTFGFGRYGTIGNGTGGGRTQMPDLSAMIDTSACVQRHAPPTGWSVKLEVETTRDEIVDVQIRNGAGAMADCLVEATWNVRLDARFYLPREVFVVDLL